MCATVHSAQVNTESQIKGWPLHKEPQAKTQAASNLNKPFPQHFCKQKIKKKINYALLYLR